ncbi:UBX domain-containing protein 1-A [Biomphalaria pfeifferi]|uniref:UBX domain-containing protein 1-A n=1 Tax=Biomphalaria pfeifferi TaxID=112525 RepID=A0AAD8F296_BIOPF|nr:UBX domain-containing protein 1-A [Biomphalaria pfeifferi]
MASGTRSKAHNDLMQKIAEFKGIAATLYNDEAERKKYVRERFEAFEKEEERKEKEREEEEERRLAREHELAMKALDQKIREISERYSPQSLELSTTPARQDQEAEESETTTHVQIGYTAQTDTEVAAKNETFIPDSPPLGNSTLSTQPNPPAQSNSPANCVAPNEPTSPSKLAPPRPPTPTVKLQHHKAPIQQPAAHKDCNHPARKPRHNQNNQAHRDCNNSTRGNNPNRAYRDCNNSMRSHKTIRQKQQASQTISVMTAVPKLSESNQ